MRLYEKLLRCPTISQECKELIKSSQRIVADNVADYYYRGTDQEYWRIATDFPNLAPPFECCFIECRAPQSIVSREFGTKPWSPDMGYEWGILCTAVSRTQRLEALRDEQGRRLLWREARETLAHLEPTLQDWQQGHIVAPPKLEGDLEQLAFAPELLETHIEHTRQLLAWMQEGSWDQVLRLFESEPWEWTLDLLTFVNFSRGEKDLLGPLWWTRLRIRENGEVQTNDQGVAVWEDEPLGVVHEYLHLVRTQGASAYATAVHQARLSLAPLQHTALLTISFLHCKNVALQEVRPPKKPLSNSQRRRGERPRPPLSYHVLDIRPMRQVLRTEGQEARLGTRRALHICRGHFAHYKERGLFGKYKGTFWIPQHVRGSAEQGVQVKDYRIVLPDQKRPQQ
jgi:hypothetical protein